MKKENSNEFRIIKNLKNGQAVEIRPAEEKDYEKIILINEGDVKYTSPMDMERTGNLHSWADTLLVALLDGEVEAFIIALREGTAYDSVNYIWFEEHFPEFLYVDRIVVSDKAKGLGIGNILYEQVFAHGKDTGAKRMAAEIDIKPPNDISLEFHKKFGFKEVGSHSVQGGSKLVSLQISEL